MGYFVYASETGLGLMPNRPFRLGLDLSGGTHLVYKADVSDIPAGEVGSAMSALKEVIERRINVFGVSEPIIQISPPAGANVINKLIVELPRVTDVNEALAVISKTPLLEFKVEGEKDAPLNLNISRKI